MAPPHVMPRLKQLAALLLLVAPISVQALASEARATLGDAEVRFDRERWRASVRENGVNFEPQGKSGSKLDDVELSIRDDAPCRELALLAFQFGHYDTDGMAVAPITIGGRAGERFEAHTGCRNATPRGVVACVKSGGRAYLLTSLNAGCHGRNLFSGIDPIAEIASGVSFPR